MNFFERLGNKLFEFFILVQSFGKKNEYIYIINNSLFYIRKNTSDKFTVDEIWKHNIYNIQIKKDDMVVDLGANIGAFTIFAAKIALNGKVFAFEPERSNYQQLVKNIDLNKLKNSFPYKLGVAHKKCTLPLFLSNENKGAASIYESHSEKKEKINCMILEEIFKLCNIENIDILKMDIEGAEYDVLFSTPKHIFKRINCIVLEFHDFLNLKHNYKELISFLEKMSFKITVSSPRTYIHPRMYAKLFKKGVLTAIK